jgi:hypothetical protein
MSARHTALADVPRIVALLMQRNHRDLHLVKFCLGFLIGLFLWLFAVLPLEQCKLQPIARSCRFLRISKVGVSVLRRLALSGQDFISLSNSDKKTKQRKRLNHSL